MSETVFYRCESCGNIVALIKLGGGMLSCCGETMKKLVANSTDAAKEKHVPVVTKDGGEVKVVVGATLHPMLPEHHIEWIALVTSEKIEFRFLKPGDKPKAEFDETESGTVYATVRYSDFKNKATAHIELRLLYFCPFSRWSASFLRSNYKQPRHVHRESV